LSGPGLASRLRPAAHAAAVAVGVAVLGALATDLGPWYRDLVKPAFQPPDWLFGPAWTLIYACAAAAAVEAWLRAPDPLRRREVVELFLLNGILNLLWSILFFRLRRPDWALLEVGALWLSVLVLLLVVRGFSRPSAWLLLPYLAWVGFAAILNLAIVHLNAPFGGP
jgi:tryptophan-rich sensory protein